MYLRIFSVKMINSVAFPVNQKNTKIAEANQDTHGSHWGKRYKTPKAGRKKANKQKYPLALIPYLFAKHIHEKNNIG